MSMITLIYIVDSSLTWSVRKSVGRIVLSPYLADFTYGFQGTDSPRVGFYESLRAPALGRY